MSALLDCGLKDCVMPSGKVHNTVTLLATPLVCVSAYGISEDAVTVLCVGVGMLSGLVLTPDLDVDNGSRSNYHIRKWFGNVAEKIWRIYWYPYAKIIPHRSALSHFPVISTLIRVLYLFWPILFINPTLITKNVFIIIIGLVISDTLHWFMDVLSSE